CETTPHPPPAVGCSGWLGGNDILTLDEAAGILPRSDVPEDDVALDGTKERDPGANQHRNAGDDEALNQTRLEKPLNGDPAIHVNMLDSARGQLRHDVGRSSRHPLHHPAEWSRAERAR